MFLKGRIALVTGSTSGIGAACAAALAGEGAAVMTNGFGDGRAIVEQLAALSALSGAKAAYCSADLSQVEAVQAMYDQCVAELGAPDIIVNNAGIQHVSPVEIFPVDKWRQMQAIMLDAPFLLMRAAIPQMRTRGWGRIISTASAHATVASPNKAAYVTAKHGLLGLTRTVALETAAHGITVNTIAPGYVWTPLVENQIPDIMKTRGLTRDQVINDVLLATTPQKKFVMPEQVAALLLFLCSEAACTITGANLPIDGGWTAH